MDQENCPCERTDQVNSNRAHLDLSKSDVETAECSINSVDHDSGKYDLNRLEGQKERLENVSNVVQKLQSIPIDSENTEIYLEEKNDIPEKISSKIKFHRPLPYHLSDPSYVQNLSYSETCGSRIQSIIFKLENKLKRNKCKSVGSASFMETTNFLNLIRNMRSQPINPNFLNIPFTPSINEPSLSTPFPNASSSFIPTTVVSCPTTSLTIESSRNDENRQPMFNKLKEIKHVGNNHNVCEDSSDSNDEHLETVSRLTSTSGEGSEEDSSDGISDLLDYDYLEIKVEKMANEDGLSGSSLYRCGNDQCCYSSQNVSSFYDHLLVCEFSEIQFNCYHCPDVFEDVRNLVEHVKTHGVKRFGCSLCIYKSPLQSSAKSHIKDSHQVSQLKCLPVIKAKNNLEKDSFVIVPKRAIFGVSKSKHAKDTFTPDTADMIPTKPDIYQNPVRCGICDFSTKVRSNLVKHLRYHAAGLKPPDITPVNPSPITDEGFETNYIRMKTNNNVGMRSNIPTDKVQIVPLSDKVMSNLPELIPETLRFTCSSPGCKYVTVDGNMLYQHVELRHPSLKAYDCPHCNDVHVPIDNMLVHLKCHGDELYKCSCCMYYHWQKRSVEKHIKNIHDGKNVVVIDVREEADIKEKLKNKNRKRLIFTNDPYKCGLCDKSTETIEGIKKHCKEEHGIATRYKCLLCDETSDIRDDVQNHVCTAHKECSPVILKAYYIDSVTCTDLANQQKILPLWKRQNGGLRKVRGIPLDDNIGEKIQKIQLDGLNNDRKNLYVDPQNLLPDHEASWKVPILCKGKKRQANKEGEDENENMKKKIKKYDADIHSVKKDCKVRSLELSPYNLCKSYKCSYCPKISQNLDQIHKHYYKYHADYSFEYFVLSRDEMINFITKRESNTGNSSLYTCVYCEKLGNIMELEVHTKSAHLGEVLKVTTFQNCDVHIYLECQHCGYLCCEFENTNQRIHIEEEHPHEANIIWDRYMSKKQVGPNAFTSPNQTFNFNVHEADGLVFCCPHNLIPNDNIPESRTPSICSKPITLSQVKCSFSTQNLAQINKHLRRHTRSYKCGHCGQTLSDSSKFHEHSALWHGNRTPDLVKDLDGDAEYEGLKGLLEWNIQKQIADKKLGMNSTEKVLKLRMAEQKSVLEGRSKNVARKSTGLGTKLWDETKSVDIPYSFYNVKPEKIDLKNVKTRITVGNQELIVNVKEIGRFINMQPRLRLRDCKEV